MAGLVPAIHVFLLQNGQDVDGRNKSGHDELTDADAPGSEPPVRARVHSDPLEQRPTTARQRMEHLSYPNESKAYRAARNALLDEEIALRAQIEAVAAKRRALPPGGEVPQDYVFERIGTTQMPEQVKMSKLFGPHDTLILYSFMYGPERESPCPGCTHLLDGIDGAARHLGERAAFHVVAKSPIARLAAWAHERGWEHMSLISTAGNSYDADYFGDTSKFSKGMRQQHQVPDGENWDETIFNVFKKQNGTIRHFWGSELSFALPAPGQHHRAGDMADPLWNLLDMTPEGRGGDWFPKVEY
jgi:predicted dithiol-disulfide oxidoreductase (DUF899 family)